VGNETKLGLATMKTAAQLIAEMEQKYAEIARVEAEQYAASAKILAWMFAELNTAAVKERFPDVRFHLVADEGPPFVIYWGDKLLGRVGDSQDGGVRAVIGSDKSIERFTTKFQDHVSDVIARHWECRHWPRAICRPMARAMIRIRGSMGATAALPLSFPGLRSGLGASVSERVGGLSSGIMTLSPGLLCATLATERALQRTSCTVSASLPPARKPGW
jgi:hypothetical protein